MRGRYEVMQGLSEGQMVERIPQARRINKELTVGLTAEQAQALAVATDFQGLKPSVYCRGAILHRLVAEGWLRHPGLVHDRPAGGESNGG